jgi:hypothetical protein
MYEMNENLAHAAANLLGAVRGLDIDIEKAAAHVEHALKVRQYIAIGYQCWGRGSNPADAVDNMVKEGGKRNHYILYDGPRGTYVDGFGGLTYPGALIDLFGDEAKPKEIERKAPKSKARKR